MLSKANRRGAAAPGAGRRAGLPDGFPGGFVDRAGRRLLYGGPSCRRSRPPPESRGPARPCRTPTLSLCPSARSPALSGQIRVPGDKSISHRALMFGAIATRRTTHHRAAGGRGRAQHGQGAAGAGLPDPQRPGMPGRCWGAESGDWPQPDGELDFGNSGTGTRLMMGLLAGHDMTVRMTGDASLSKRPMARVLDPLKRMGLEVLDGAVRLPLTLRGTADLVPIEYRLPVPSAQIKSAILIAGLHASGRHDRHRGGGDARPHRAHAAPFRGRGAVRRAGRRAGHHGHGRRRAGGARGGGAGRSELGGLPGGGGADRAGIGDHHRGRAGQPDAHRLLHDAARDGRRRRLPQRARGGRRADRRYPRAPLQAEGCAGAAGACAQHDRRIPDAGLPRRLCRRRDAHGGAGRAEGEGERPPGCNGRRARRQRRGGQGRRRYPDRAGWRWRARRRDGRHPPRPSHRHGLPDARPRRRPAGHGRRHRHDRHQLPRVPLPDGGIGRNLR